MNPIRLSTLCLFAGISAHLGAEPLNDQALEEQPAEQTLFSEESAAAEQAVPEQRLEERPSAVLLEIGPEDADYKAALIELSKRYLATGHSAEFRETLEQLQEHFPHDRLARRYYGSGWLRLGAWDRLEDIRETHKMTSTDPHATLGDALTVFGQGNLIQALILMEAAYRSAPEDPLVLLHLGNYFCRFYNCVEGMQLLKKLTEVDPENAQGFLALARAAAAMRLPEEGLAAIHRAEDLMRDDPETDPRLNEEVESLLVFFFDLQNAEE